MASSRIAGVMSAADYGHSGHLRPLRPGASEPPHERRSRTNKAAAAVDRLDATGRNRTDKRGYGQTRNPAYPKWWS